MNTLKKCSAFLLCVIMLFACACSDKTPSAGSDSTPPSDGIASHPEVLSLFYCAKDSLNPYAASTEFNVKLQALMYDPLVRIDPSFQPEYVIAESIELLGKTCTVTLKSIAFSDGSVLTADDVVYSLKLAKESSLTYADQLSCVSGYKSEGGKVIITLTKADPYFVNLLDFPIIKAHSESITDENKIVLAPIGSGRYVFDREKKCLNSNDSHILGAPTVKTIQLVDAPDSEVTKFNLEAGNVSLYTTDLSSGEMPSMIGTISKAPLNNLIYLGVNLKRSTLADVKMRYALSYAIDRAEICENAYYSYALPATGLFSPLWQDAKGLQNIPSTDNLQNAIANLGELGYNSRDNEGFFIGNNGKRLSLTLICNDGNSRRVNAASLIKAQIEALGIAVNVKTLSWDAYSAALSAGDFDLYIAEVKLLNNMDVTELVTSEGSLSYGIPDKVTEPTAAPSTTSPDSDPNKDAADIAPSTALAIDDTAADGSAAVPNINDGLDNSVAGFYGEQLSLIDIINAFNAEMPIIPICYRSGITVYDASLNAENMSSVSDAYYNLANIKLK